MLRSQGSFRSLIVNYFQEARANKKSQRRASPALPVDLLCGLSFFYFDFNQTDEGTAR